MSGGWQVASDEVQGTLYGPAIRGTMQAVDGEALRRLVPPAVPRPVMVVDTRGIVSGMVEDERGRGPMSRLAIAGLVLAVPASPVGLVVSAIALGQILSGRCRGRGEGVALAGVVASVLMMTALVSIVM